jgi:chromosome segregation ATPase
MEIVQNSQSYDDDLPTTFNGFIRMTGEILAQYDQQSNENSDLKHEIEMMQAEIGKMRKSLKLQSEELLEKDRQLTECTNKEIERIKEDAAEERAQATLARCRYEHDVLDTHLRTARRELQVQKGEIERLTRANQALLREKEKVRLAGEQTRGRRVTSSITGGRDSTNVHQNSRHQSAASAFHNGSN